MTRRTGYLLGAAAGVLVALLAGCGGEKSNAAPPKAAGPPVPVTVSPVVQKTVPVQLRAIGNVEAYTTVSVKPQVNGEILRVHVAIGQTVKRADLLFTIDPRPLEASLRQAESTLARDRAQREQAVAALAQRRAELRQAEANLTRDTAQLEHARVEEHRYSTLVEKELVAKEQYDQIKTTALAWEASVQADQAAVENTRAGIAAAQAAITNAEAVIAADQAAVDNARVQLGYCTIRSPIDGRAGDILVHAGNVVKANPDNPLMVITQVHPIYVTFTVPEQNLGDIKKYQAAGTLQVQAVVPNQSGDVETGALTFMNNTVDVTTGTIQLKATFDNADNGLWPGQFVDVVLTLTNQPNVLVVPSQAVQTGQKGAYVFVVKHDQSVESRPVTVDRALDQHETVIARGLRVAEMVVTDGQARLLPGAKVVVKSPSPGKPPAPTPKAG